MNAQKAQQSSWRPAQCGLPRRACPAPLPGPLLPATGSHLHVHRLPFVPSSHRPCKAGRWESLAPLVLESPRTLRDYGIAQGQQQKGGVPGPEAQGQEPQGRRALGLRRNGSEEFASTRFPSLQGFACICLSYASVQSLPIFRCHEITFSFLKLRRGLF